MSSKINKQTEIASSLFLSQAIVYFFSIRDGLIYVEDVTRNISWLPSVDYWKCAQHVCVCVCKLFYLVQIATIFKRHREITRLTATLSAKWFTMHLRELSEYAEILLKLVDKGWFFFVQQQTLKEIHPVRKRCVLCTDAIELECNDMQFTCTFNVAFWASVVVVTDVAVACPFPHATVTTRTRKRNWERKPNDNLTVSSKNKYILKCAYRADVKLRGQNHSVYAVCCPNGNMLLNKLYGGELLFGESQLGACRCDNSKKKKTKGHQKPKHRTTNQRIKQSTKKKQQLQ